MCSRIIEENNLWRCIVDLDGGSPDDILVDASTKDEALYTAFTNTLKNEKLWIWEEVLDDADLRLKYKHLFFNEEEVYDSKFHKNCIISLIDDLKIKDDQIIIDAKRVILEDYWEFITRFK